MRYIVQIELLTERGLAKTHESEVLEEVARVMKEEARFPVALDVLDVRLKAAGA
jgi:hypothetical protein